MSNSDRSGGDPKSIFIAELEAQPLNLTLGEPIPLETPFIDRPTLTYQRLLRDNGFAETPSQWRLAAAGPHEMLRAAAYAVLADLAEEQDRPIFERGILDATPGRVYAAWGLIRLGDDSGRGVLERELGENPRPGRYGPFIAAGFLARLGDPTAFAVIADHFETSEEPHNILMFGVMPFAALHGREYRPGKTIDIWALYHEALQKDADVANFVALQQLEELDDSAGVPLIEALLQRVDVLPYVRNAAEVILPTLGAPIP